MTKTAKTVSTHAAVAKLARAYLKTLGVTATVRSESFSMGNAVRVKVIDATAEQRELIERELGQYQYGSFDSMQDYYDTTTNRRDDIPQVKYMSIAFDYSDEVVQAAYDWLRTRLVNMNADGAAELPECVTDLKFHHTVLGRRPGQLLHDTLSGKYTLCGETFNINAA